MKTLPLILSGLLLASPPLSAAPAATSAKASAPAPQAQVDSDRFLATVDLNPSSPATVTTRCDAAAAMVKKMMADLAARKGGATVDTDFRTFDALSNMLSGAGGEAYFIAQTNVAKPVRDAGRACAERLSAIGTDLSLSRPIYDRLVAISQAGLDKPIAFTLNKTLLQYRLAGVDRDAATRAKGAALNKQITATGLEFGRNISEDKSEITLANADALKGLPQDYIDSHKPGKDGLIHITTTYPDVFPLLQYGDDSASRKAIYLAFSNRAYPANVAVLERLLKERAELATLLGFSDYATLITSDKMIGTPKRAWSFLDEVNDASSVGAKADYARLLARLQQIDPKATAIQPWDTSYLSRLVQKEQYEVDSAVVRQYFTLDKARTGIFGLVHDLFGSDIRPWKTPVWAPGVTAWELYDGDRLTGRFYLDLSPRDGKYSHAAQFNVRIGLADRQVPIAALVTNFPAEGPMSRGDVETFLHEFGHLLHNLYSGSQQFSSQSMGSLEWDFIEAPSQLLEEWIWDYDTLHTFATNPAGEPIPKALVDKLNASRRFGEGMSMKQQLAYAAISLGFYDRAAGFNLDEAFLTHYNRYSLLPESPDAHMFAAFGHLDGYSAIYYTYVWSRAIASDLATRFKKAGLRDPATARAYRQAVLDPGGSEPATVLIERFLGREFNTDALREELAPMAAPVAAPVDAKK